VRGLDSSSLSDRYRARFHIGMIERTTPCMPTAAVRMFIFAVGGLGIFLGNSRESREAS
jgi:hypothetical protein